MNAEARAQALLRKNILICAGGSLGVANLPTVLSQIRTLVPESSLRVVLTPNAALMVSAVALACLTNAPVLSKWPEVESSALPHITWTDWADVVLVMPATANLLGKVAHGIADDLVTTCLLAFEGPIIFVPSMNPRMWTKPVVQDNVARLVQLGCHVLEPAQGLAVATGELGEGALPPLRDLLIQLLRILDEESA